MDRGTLNVRGARVGIASDDCASRLPWTRRGASLVDDFEEQVRLRGGLTIYLGTDDENDRTSLGGVDLYLDPLGAAARIQNLGRHPFEFYRKVGFVIVGVLPDANGYGKPDIFMAKRVRNRA
jgi:aminoglycoside 6'-N-acetyltransferase I